jgi:hypothetical protein
MAWLVVATVFLALADVGSCRFRGPLNADEDVQLREYREQLQQQEDQLAEQQQQQAAVNPLAENFFGTQDELILSQSCAPRYDDLCTPKQYDCCGMALYCKCPWIGKCRCRHTYKSAPSN